MNPQVKQKWIEALRSEKYPQGIKRLHNITTNEYCCLGVLCEIALQEGVNIVKDVYTDAYGSSTIYGESVSLLPPTVLNWSGLQGVSVFYSMNDLQRKSFAEIADYIEKEL